MKKRPGKGLLGWLGRQVGYVTGAARRDVGTKVLYRNRSVEEKSLPDQPHIILRRTVVDEAVRKTGNDSPKEPRMK